MSRNPFASAGGMWLGQPAMLQFPLIRKNAALLVTGTVVFKSLVVSKFCHGPSKALRTCRL